MSNQPSDAITRAHLGRRVTLRRVVGERDGRPLFSDVVGELIDVRDDLLVVRRRDGSVVEVDSGSVAAAKVVPHQNRPLSAIDWSEPELERVAAQGWRALEVERLGEWLLRASAGFSRRANSVLPLGVSGRNPPRRERDQRQVRRLSRVRRAHPLVAGAFRLRG